MNIIYKRYLENLDKDIAKAVDNRDALVYFHKCNEAGIEPNLLDLYEQGQVEDNLIQGSLEKSVSKESKSKPRKRTVSNKTYERFYNEASGLNLNIGLDTDKKYELLARYFPGRFGDKGRTTVCNMDYLSVGALFRKMFNYSEKRVNE